MSNPIDELHKKLGGIGLKSDTDEHVVRACTNTTVNPTEIAQSCIDCETQTLFLTYFSCSYSKMSTLDRLILQYLTNHWWCIHSVQVFIGYSSLQE